MSVAGEWFRWSAYDLDCGSIVPAEGAALEKYDPWADFVENEGMYRTVDQPYAPVLDLARDLEMLEERGVQPSRCNNRNFLEEPLRGPQNEADAAILAWVHSHGLLGVLPVTASAIRGSVEEKHVMGGALRALSRRSHFRIAGGEWVGRKLPLGVYVEAPDAARDAAAKFEKKDPPPGASVLDWRYGPEEKPLQWVREFFIPVRYGPAGMRAEPFSPPCPGSREFEETYCEPLREFITGVRNFRLAVNTLSRWQGGADETAREGAAEAHWFLASLAQSAAPALRLPQRADDGSPPLGWIASELRAHVPMGPHGRAPRP